MKIKPATVEIFFIIIVNCSLQDERNISRKDIQENNFSGISPVKDESPRILYEYDS